MYGTDREKTRRKAAKDGIQASNSTSYFFYKNTKKGKNANGVSLLKRQKATYRTRI
jgi:hypothetical protein